MPNKSITSFSGNYLTTNGQWPDNLVGDITAARLRAGILDTWDSFTFSDATLTSNLSTVSGIVNSGLFTNVTATNNISGKYITENGIRLAQGIYTGLITGGVVTQNGASGIVVAAGSGIVVDHTTTPSVPVVTLVAWNQISGVVISDLTAKFTKIAITNSGTVYQKAGVDLTSAEEKTHISLATILTPNLAINGVQADVRLTWDTHGLICDLEQAVGPLTMEGNVFSHQGSGLLINKSSGSTFNGGVNYYNTNTSANITTDAQISGVTFQYKYRNGTGGYATATATTTIVPGSYDDGDGTLGSVGNSEWTIQRIYYAPITNKVFIHYGQTKYGTLAAAQAGIYSESFTSDPVLSLYNTLRCYLLVRGNATNLADTVNNLFVCVNKFGAAVGTIVSTTSLQQAYDNSASPEIVTDSARDGFTVKEGTGVGQYLYEGLNSSDVRVFSVNASGHVVGNSGVFESVSASGLVLPKAGSTGIKVDLASPTFGWKDLIGQIVPRTGAEASTAPALVAFRGANILTYAFDTNDVIDSITYHMPHDYLPGSDMFIHTHWGHNGTSITGVFAITYYIEYCKGYNQAGQVFNSQVTLPYANSGVYSVTTHPRWGHFIEEVQMTSATGSASTLDKRLLEVDGLINVGFKLITKPTITGGTTSPFIFMVDIHYQTNGVIGTKDKNYPFYT